MRCWFIADCDIYQWNILVRVILSFERCIVKFGEPSIIAVGRVQIYIIILLFDAQRRLFATIIIVFLFYSLRYWLLKFSFIHLGKFFTFLYLVVCTTYLFDLVLVYVIMVMMMIFFSIFAFSLNFKFLLYFILLLYFRFLLYLGLFFFFLFIAVFSCRYKITSENNV